MLNIVKSMVITMLSLTVSLISFIRGPILLGLVIALSILSFAKKAEAGTQIRGTQSELIQANKDVVQGIYVREDGARVAKPNTTICNEYRNTYLKYASKYGSSRGSLIWLVIVTRRGC